MYLPGFVFLENKEEKLDEKIDEFISKGSKPIVISFSSMPLKIQINLNIFYLKL
ncbi:hypothetical protein Q5M85_01050 [Paraclostridium bifermentans]|nr:hypothetical protein [Paraclostridium bifermentans]